MWVQPRDSVDATPKVELIGHVEGWEELVTIGCVEGLQEADAFAIHLAVLDDHLMGFLTPNLTGIFVLFDVVWFRWLFHGVLWGDASDAVVLVPSHVQDSQDERVDCPCCLLCCVHRIVHICEVHLFERLQVCLLVCLNELDRTYTAREVATLGW